MKRRRFLETVAAGLPVGIAGCVGDGGVAAGSDRDGGAATGDGAAPDFPLSEADLGRAAPKDRIPAITDPAFARDWSGVTATLGVRDRVVGVERRGEARAYPLPILNWHEVVNDSFGGPLLVTYCPLCGSGVTAKRRVDGEVATFGVSGYLWKRDLVLYDDLTGSLWSQIRGQAVRGPQTGERLTLVPSTLTTWGEWRRAHPETTVLVPPPVSETVTGTGRRNYNTNPYGDYQALNQPRFGDTTALDPKTFVVGVIAGDAATAYPYRAVVEADGVVNDRVGDLPVVVATTRESLVAYVRRVDGETLVFDRTDDALVAGGSRWTVVSGRATSGPYEGVSLARANDRSPMFWFAWRDFFPETGVYSRQE